MREMVHEALAGAREMVGEVVGDLRAEARLTDDEVLARYVGQHQGKPWAMLEFAQAAGGGDVLEEALRYEKEMEKLLGRRGQGGAVREPPVPGGLKSSRRE